MPLPAFKVSAPVNPFKLVTPAVPPPVPSNESRNVISNPEESCDSLASWAPARSTEPRHPSPWP
jgi:hypothetical protein